MKDGDYLFKRILAGLLSTVLIAGTSAIISGCDQSSSGTSDSVSTPAQNKTTDADSIAKGTILQCFCWDFNTIKESMADIASAGFTAVQTSPINECLEGEDGGMELYGNGKWYYHYQPTDFKIGNYQLGRRDEFKAMCEEADKYGISVIVDVIANHTTPTTDAISKDLIEAGGGSLETLYHEGNSHDLSNYSNRLDCTTYKMGGLPDINTERPSFQNYFFEYINDCIECGADGFRYDTAKHIGLPDDPKEDDGFKNNFWEKATTSVNNADSLFIYGEVLQGNNDRIKDYIAEIGRTTASTYGSKIRSAVSNNMLLPNSVSDYWLGDIDPNVVTWVESHDNYINDGTAYSHTNEQIILGWAIITARKDGTPLFFDRPYNSNMDNIWGMNRIGTQGDDFYKESSVKAVNFFRTAMQGEDENLVTPGEDTTALIIERGNKGAVIVNTEGDLKTGFEIGLADGTYVDRVDNKTTYTVSNGKLTSDTDIPANSVVVLYNDGYKESSLSAEVGVSDDTEFVYDSESIEVTLTCSNTEDAAYSIDGAKPVQFKDGDKIKIDRKDDSSTTEVILTATNKEGAKTYEELVFTYKMSYNISKGDKVYFEKPDEWDDQVFAYVYNDDLYENDIWPGVEMEKTSDGKYCYTFTKSFETPYIIFNDGDAADSVQYPEGQGLVVEPGKTYTVE